MKDLCSDVPSGPPYCPGPTAQEQSSALDGACMANLETMSLTAVCMSCQWLIC